MVNRFDKGTHVSLNGCDPQFKLLDQIEHNNPQSKLKDL